MRQLVMTGLALAFMGLIATAAMAESVNTDGSGLAIRGYDPVAYFKQQAAAPGDPAITAEHDGATYRFSTEENRETFLSDPARYAPAYGGYCAYGMAKGYKAKIEPDAFTIVNDRLYLNYDQTVRALWQQDVSGYVDSADANWPKVSQDN